MNYKKYLVLIPGIILAFVLYLGGTAIMTGFEAKRENRSNESLEDQDQENSLSDNNNKLTD